MGDEVAMKSTRRLNINISEETASALQELAEKSGTNVTNVVRRAVGVYKFLDDELAGKDRTLQIVDKESNQATTVAILT